MGKDSGNQGERMKDRGVVTGTAGDDTKPFPTASWSKTKATKGRNGDLRETGGKTERTAGGE